MTHTDLIDRLRKLNLAVAADALSAQRKERRMPDAEAIVICGFWVLMAWVAWLILRN